MLLFNTEYLELDLISVRTDLCRFPKSNAQYLALNSDRLSLPVEADRTLAPVRPRILGGLFTGEDSKFLGGQGGFRDTFPEIFTNIIENGKFTDN